MIWAGSGAIGGDGVQRLAERIGAPVVTTYGASGLLAPAHPCSVGMPPHVEAVGPAVGRRRSRHLRRVGPRRRADAELRPAAAAARARDQPRRGRRDEELRGGHRARSGRERRVCGDRGGRARAFHERARRPHARAARGRLRHARRAGAALPRRHPLRRARRRDRGRGHVHPGLLAGRVPHALASAQAADPARLGHAGLRVPGGARRGARRPRSGRRGRRRRRLPLRAGRAGDGRAGADPADARDRRRRRLRDAPLRPGRQRRRPLRRGPRHAGLLRARGRVRDPRAARRRARRRLRRRAGRARARSRAERARRLDARAARAAAQHLAELVPAQAGCADAVIAFRIARHRLGARVADASTAAFPGLAGHAARRRRASRWPRAPTSAPRRSRSSSSCPACAARRPPSRSPTSRCSPPGWSRRTRRRPGT